MPGPLRDVEQRISLDASGYDAGTARIIADNRAMIASYSDVIAKVGEMRAALGALPDSKSIRISVDSGGALAEIAKIKAELDALPDSKVITVGVAGAGGGGDAAAMIRELRDISASMDMATSSMGRMEDHLTVISKNAQDSSADLMMQTQILRDNASAHNAAATAAAAFAATGRGGGRGGGGGWGAAAAGAAAGAAGGGGGGGGGGFVPWAGGGFAAVRFWGMMGAEIASTVVPAIVAAGSAALVGAQGFEQLQGRAQAVYAVSEALGSSLHMTAGQFVGVGNALQTAQNAASGGVYGLAGAGINILKSGTGTGFLGMGTSTLSMLDRAAAGAVTNLTSGGTGQKLLGALGGGTGYLQQFGQIGANLGTSLLNFAPNLPGVGSDLLSTVTGASGLLRGASELPSPLLKGFFTYEAASRWLPALLGGKGLIGRMLGLRAGGWGLGGLLEKGGAGGIGGLLGKIGLGGAGDALAGLTGPEVGIPLAAFQLESSLLDKLPQGAGGAAAANISKWQSQVATSGFASAWQPLGHGLTMATAGAAAAPYQAPPSQAAIMAAGGRVGIGLEAAYASSPKLEYTQAANQFAQQMGELVNAGPQLQGALKKLGLSGGSLAETFQIAQNALLDIPHAFGKNGKVNSQAIQQLADLAVTIGPMTQSQGAFGAATAGYQIMNSPAMKNLAIVNQAMDAMTQIMSAGPAGAAALTTMRGAIPQGYTGALGQGITTQAGAAAMTAFASTTQPSIISGLQQQADQMRTALTLNAVTQPQAAGMMGYQLQQFLPLARNNPAALAMLMQQGSQMGIGGYYDPTKTQGQNYAAEVAATAKIADNAKQANQAYNSMTIHLANLPTTAQQFAQGTNAAIQAQQEAKAAQDAMNIKGGINIKANTADLISQLKAAGVQGGTALKASLDAILKQAGVGAGQIAKINLQLDAQNALSQIHQMQSAITALHGKNVQATATVTGAANVAALQQAIDILHGKNVNITAVTNVQAVYLMSAAIAAVQSRNVTVTVTTIYRNVIETVTGPTTGAGTYGVSTVNPQGFVNAYPVRAHQQGFRVPGWGGGDIWPALLEPGEAVVPKHLVAAVAPFLSAHNVPGFAGGRIPNAMWVPPTDGPGNPNWLPGGGLPIPAAAQKVLDQLLAELSKSGAWKQAGVSIINGITYSLSGTGKDAGKVGAALVQQAASAAATLGHKVQAAFNLARGVAGAALAGQGYGTQGLISGMNVTPGTGGGTVLEQMQSYLGSEQSFTKDIASLRKQHLSKALIAQMVAAGPVQGDALAQSVLNDYGGVKAVNATWNQIGQASKGLGAQAAMAQYGGTIAPNLRSGTISQNTITINVNAPGGGTGNLPLTTNQINAIVREIEAKLLQQARRNRKTGVQAHGKGA